MKYKTHNNLNHAWIKVDNMLSEWYNLVEFISDINFDDEEKGMWSMEEMINRFDPNQLISIKNYLECLMDKK